MAKTDQFGGIFRSCHISAINFDVVRRGGIKRLTHDREKVKRLLSTVFCALLLVKDNLLTTIVLLPNCPPVDRPFYSLLAASSSQCIC